MAEGYDYFRLPRQRYIPMTPAAALRALRKQALPEEAFVHLGTSARPLDDEPVNLGEIERVLAREDLDLDTNLLLIRVLEKLVRSKDPEVALFAAESINIIEHRYNQKIESLKEKLEEGREDALLRELARLYFELSQIHPASIRNFYLREAYGYLVQIGEGERREKEDDLLMLRVLMELGSYDQVIGELERLGERDDPDFLLIKAELEFRRKDFLQVIHLCTRLFDREEELDEAAKSLVAYWLGIR